MKITKLFLLLGCLFCACVVFADECKDCGKNRFGQNVCIFHGNCQCDCEIGTAPPFVGDCITFNGPCRNNLCLFAPSSSAKPSLEQQQAYQAAHPWINDASIVSSVEAHSGAMASTLRLLQEMNKGGDRFSDAAGVLAPDKSNPFAKVSFELIERTNGMDEIRLNNELTKQRELMVFVMRKKKWYLFSVVPTADHANNKEVVAEGDLQ
jgi:hypothetical protein